MAIDVTAQATIQRDREEVAAYAFDPVNDPAWIGGISEARPITDPPFGVGTQVERVAYFLGRRIEYVLEVEGYEPGKQVAMQSIKGPFPMKVTYTLSDHEDGTLAHLRVEGDTTGFFSLAAPLMARMVQRNIQRDVEALRDVMESGGDR